MSNIENYAVKGDRIIRSLRLRNGSLAKSAIKVSAPPSGPSIDLAAAYDLAWLSSSVSPFSRSSSRKIFAVDLFSGCGGLTLGVKEAARAVGADLRVKLAVDVDEDALRVFGLNFPEAALQSDPVERILDGRLGGIATKTEQALKSKLGRVDLLVGGPPCQGHSDLNNHTRNVDVRNELYLRMARFCEIIMPKHVIIENVPGVIRDKNRVVQRTWHHLEKLGYVVQTATVDVSKYGVAQKRKRNVTIASLKVGDDFQEFMQSVETPARSLRWAVRDLSFTNSNSTLWDSSPTPSLENSRRMKYLFDKDLYELPNSQRPDCHRLKKHSYVSVYGRLHWEKPAPTITTGFGSMGRGRYVHPSKPRTITPHEAARIQFFPDFFQFTDCGRTLLQMLIGNAVPPKLGYLLGIFLLR